MILLEIGVGSGYLTDVMVGFVFVVVVDVVDVSVIINGICCLVLA